MAKTILELIIEYLNQQKTFGKSEVKRKDIYTVCEYVLGIDAIFSGKALSRHVMQTAAEAVGGTYVVPAKGNARVVFAQ